MHRLLKLSVFSLLLAKSGHGFAGVNSSGGPAEPKRTLIINCEAEDQGGTIYQLLISPPQAIRFDDSSAEYPVRMYRYKNNECDRVEGFSSAKLRVMISDAISMSFGAPRDERAQEFNGSGWELFFSPEKRIASGLQEGRFEAHMQFQVGFEGGAKNLKLFCATTPTMTKDLARRCTKYF